MKDDFFVLIQNRTEFENGNPAGVWLSLPATREELAEAMKALHITADNPQDFFLNGYSTEAGRRVEIPFEHSTSCFAAIMISFAVRRE